MNQVSGNLDDFVRKQIKINQSPEMENEFRNIQNQLSASSQKIQRQIESIDSTLNSVIQKTYDSAGNAIEKLQDRILRRIQETENLAVQHFNEIHQSIYPSAEPQERVISSVYFLNKYGPEWLNTIMTQIDLNNFKRQSINL
ncbi:MAG TPA: bacillithiol biosynthesis BshC [Caldithrix sp.]|nr:bacillithiol biosynthesis BshC [Caldithrix sp.]